MSRVKLAEQAAEAALMSQVQRVTSQTCIQTPHKAPQLQNGSRPVHATPEAGYDASCHHVHCAGCHTAEVPSRLLQVCQHRLGPVPVRGGCEGGLRGCFQLLHQLDHIPATPLTISATLGETASVLLTALGFY